MAYLNATAADVINAAAVEVGLASVADPYGATDPNFVQLCQLLNSVGRDLRRRHTWSVLTQIYTFQTVAGQSAYPLPMDYGSFIDQSGWNRTSQLPLVGPLSSQDYELLKGRLATVVFNTLFRTLQGNFQIYPDGTSAPGSYIVAYEYNSRFWVLPAGLQATTAAWNPGAAFTTGQFVTNGGNIWQCVAAGTSGTHGPIGTANTTDGVLSWTFVSGSGRSVTADMSDVILLDSQLVSRGLKLAFLAAKQMDTGYAQQDFETVLEQAINEDTMAPVLDFGRSSADSILIGDRNVPITGFGA